MKRTITLFLLTISLTQAGCVSYDAETGEYWELRKQRYKFDVVKSRLENLKVGMSKLDVLFILGSPARGTKDKWTYLPDRPGTLLPAEALVVEFENDRYVRHRYDLVLLGSRISEPFD